MTSLQACSKYSYGEKRLLDHFNLSRVHGRLLPPRLCEAVPPHPHNGCVRSELSFCYKTAAFLTCLGELGGDTTAVKPRRGAMSGAPCHGKQISPGWGLSRVKGNKQEQVWDRGGGQEHGAGQGALLRVRSPRWGCHKPAGLGSQRGQGADVTPVFGTCCGSDGVSVPLWVTASPAIRRGLRCSCTQ